MSDDSAAMVHRALMHPSGKPSLGDRLRDIATQLRQEDAVQIKATSRILGAAAKLAENHDRLIDEVVEMVEDDLDRAEQAAHATPYTVKQLKQQFPKLADAKAHFNIKASTWTALVDKLNEQPSPPPSTPQAGFAPASGSDAVAARLDAIERELQGMRSDMNRMVQLLEQLLATR